MTQNPMGDAYWLKVRDEQVERLSAALRHIGEVADAAEWMNRLAHISQVAWAALDAEGESP